MSDLPESAKPTVEECIANKWGETTSALKDRLHDGENYVRTEPLKAVAYAAAAGYVLRILPVGAMLRSTVKLALLAVKPVAVVYGAAKAYELIVSSRKN